jgi:hypothetical protein
VGILAGTLLLIACCLGLFVWLALLIAIGIGWIAVGLWVGQRLLAALKVRSGSVLAEVALGVFLITVLGRLPFCLGALFSAVIGSIGLGAVVLTRFGRQPVVSGGAETVVSPSQSLEDLDAEVLAPLAVVPVGPARVAPEPVTPVEVSESVVPGPQTAPEPESQSTPEPVVEGPVLSEAPVDPSRSLPPGPVDEEPAPAASEGESVDRMPDQPTT